MHVDDALVQAARRTLEGRFPHSGGLAAAVYTADGGLLTSVVFDPEWGGGGLCAETGALLEAHRDQRAVTAVACVSRLSVADRPVIATPCGICQERLYHWGSGSRWPCRAPMIRAGGRCAPSVRCSPTTG